MTIQKLEQLIHSFYSKRNALNLECFSEKTHPETWSKKEILGHLIDSAINNLQRFTEIQHSPKPYTIRRYNQNELVIANQYQQADLLELVDLWKALNDRALAVVRNLTTSQLDFSIITPNGEQRTLSWLIDDYKVHLEHHLSQLNA